MTGAQPTFATKLRIMVAVIAAAFLGTGIYLVNSHQLYSENAAQHDDVVAKALVFEIVHPHRAPVWIAFVGALTLTSVLSFRAGTGRSVGIVLMSLAAVPQLIGDWIARTEITESMQSNPGDPHWLESNPQLVGHVVGDALQLRLTAGTLSASLFAAISLLFILMAPGASRNSSRVTVVCAILAGLPCLIGIGTLIAGPMGAMRWTWLALALLTTLCGFFGTAAVVLLGNDKNQSSIEHLAMVPFALIGNFACTETALSAAAFGEMFPLGLMTPASWQTIALSSIAENEALFRFARAGLPATALSSVAVLGWLVWKYGLRRLSPTLLFALLLAGVCLGSNERVFIEVENLVKANSSPPLAANVPDFEPIKTTTENPHFEMMIPQLQGEARPVLADVVVVTHPLNDARALLNSFQLQKRRAGEQLEIDFPHRVDFLRNEKQTLEGHQSKASADTDDVVHDWVQARMLGMAPVAVDRRATGDELNAILRAALAANLHELCWLADVPPQLEDLESIGRRLVWDPIRFCTRISSDPSPPVDLRGQTNFARRLFSTSEIRARQFEGSPSLIQSQTRPNQTALLTIAAEETAQDFVQSLEAFWRAGIEVTLLDPSVPLR